MDDFVVSRGMARALRFIDNETGVVEVTSRTLHGRFLMKPSLEVNDIILGVLGRAQSTYPVDLFAFIFLSNHFHILMRVESSARMAAFVGYLKGNIAKELARLFDWNEKFWGRRYHASSVADSEPAQKAAFMYILRNGCKEGLVESPLEWPGVSSARNLTAGNDVLLGTWHDRTSVYRTKSRRVKEAKTNVETVSLSPLPFMDGWSSDQTREFATKYVTSVRDETRAHHQAMGTVPLGARAIERRHPHERPASFVSSPAPLFRTSTREEYRAMRFARELKVAAYRNAAKRQLRGEQKVEFPLGSFPPRPPFVIPRAPPSIQRA